MLFFKVKWIPWLFPIIGAVCIFSGEVGLGIVLVLAGLIVGILMHKKSGNNEKSTNNKTYDNGFLKDSHEAKYCPKCRSKITNDSIYCENCGTKIYYC